MTYFRWCTECRDFFCDSTDQHSITWALPPVKAQRSEPSRYYWLFPGSCDLAECIFRLACEIRRERFCSCRPCGCGWKETMRRRKLIKQEAGNNSISLMHSTSSLVYSQHSQTARLVPTHSDHCEWRLNQAWIKQFAQICSWVHICMSFVDNPFLFVTIWVKSRTTVQEISAADHTVLRVNLYSNNRFLPLILRKAERILKYRNTNSPLKLIKLVLPVFTGV